MTAAKTKELLLDSTDLRWLSEKITSLSEGNFITRSAVVASEYLKHTFTIKRRDGDDENELVLVLRVPA